MILRSPLLADIDSLCSELYLRSDDNRSTCLFYKKGTTTPYNVPRKEEEEEEEEAGEVLRVLCGPYNAGKSGIV